MKATELRIGNWVNCYAVRIEISAIAEEYVYDKTESGWFRINDLNPIPLTEQWLKDFGFVYSETKKVWMGSKSGWFWLAEKDGYYKLWYYNSLIGRPFKYVHQLQNLYFALTGEELERKKGNK